MKTGRAVTLVIALFTQALGVAQQGPTPTFQWSSYELSHGYPGSVVNRVSSTGIPIEK